MYCVGVDAHFEVQMHRDEGWCPICCTDVPLLVSIFAYHLKVMNLCDVIKDPRHESTHVKVAYRKNPTTVSFSSWCSQSEGEEFNAYLAI